MPAERPGVPIEVLRQAVREEVAKTSYRQIARETGMSISGLWRFLEGTVPYTKTQRRLQNWYVVQAAKAPAAELPVDVAEAAIALLTRHLPARRRAAHVQRLLDAVAHPDGDDPAWLRTLRHGEPPADPPG